MNCNILIRNDTGFKFKHEGIEINHDGIKNSTTGTSLHIDPRDFTITDYIGKGNSGYVQRGFHKPTNMEVAIKVVNIYEKTLRHQLKSDLKVLIKSIHPNLVQFYGAFFYEGSVNIIMELMNYGSLSVLQRRMLQIQEKIPQPILAYIAINMLKGLQYIHKIRHQIHRDIKPDNILLDLQGCVKLSDFGISKSLESSFGICHSYVGTVTYMSPERITGTAYSFSSDIWSFGLILYELFTQTYPYNSKGGSLELIDSVMQYPEPSIVKSDETALLSGFLCKMYDYT